jgi:hypothetical protein
LVHRRRRIPSGKSADERTSDERFCRPGGAIGRGERGEGRGDRGGLIGAEIDGIYSRGVTGGVTPASFRFQRERREETVAVMVLTGGSHLSARGVRELGTVSGFG